MEMLPDGDSLTTIRRIREDKRPGLAARRRPALGTVLIAQCLKALSSVMSNADRRQKKHSRRRGRPHERTGAAGAPRRRAAAAERGGELWLYGRHAVAAALANPARTVHRLLMAETEGGDDREVDAERRGPRAADGIARAAERRGIAVERASRADIAERVGPDAVHQGVAAHVAPLATARLEDACAPRDPGPNIVVALDQVTDPHNVGAILRSAAAFGARAVIVTERRAAPESGALAKAASGALEAVPYLRVANLRQALEQLKQAGYWCLGLDGHADVTLDKAGFHDRVVLVLGAEGAGLRRLTRETCDMVVKLPISGQVESLNVSNAAAVALYALRYADGS